MRSESTDDYDQIVCTLGKKHRVIVSRDQRPATQWIIQKNMMPHRPDSWRGILFFQMKSALLLHAKKFGDVTPLVALPDTCAQRDATSDLNAF